MPSTASVASASGTFLPVGLLLPTGRPFPPTSGPVISRQWTFSYSRRLPVASCQLPAACFTSTGGSIYLTGRRHLSHWSDICFLLLPVASAGEPDGSISAAKLSAMLCPQDTSSKADKAHQKPNMGACKKATSAHKRGQSMRQSKDQSGPQDRPMLQVRTRERANQPTRKAKVCARRKGQTSPQERSKYVPEEKGKPAHKKGQSMCQKKRANRPTRKAKVCARKKDKLVRKKGQSRRQSKHQSGPQERLMLQMRAREKKVFQRPSRSLSRFKAKSR
ncbi:hypothetical protein PHYBLDRAFT_144321 [Phycomyces blakesleeanus NRRL 1555(-)]|uniref:Uncharacterized protein n=1 Tax=Phycomyces blakesleeanus (strain ATCC 8743b / DSM 1359 / FGSC 10004 / NBRC 33097 / NRRL 1555) TaxID=763407 RepID=A0A167N4L1_PHYB8|nr:hypothetical protein PHYBLDRAFT_144321 [Phycomyces blakesleeanus NRRL 1555(-)]OAD74970.1 hypothetical protein PHYBLDRAFT_144321 [Phycomyces blakesleeanus NRRL 1555(-)]|eukprot:XP_018293010.1 hypothetical protein PHYBLDRAFT_144321 [Phycomyces blakesleeanus NRRL 1555(-)]